MTSSLAWTSANTSTTPASSIPKADARQGQADAMGASLDIVISSDMGKGGAMVNGQPALDDGMGAQVWAVMDDGAMESAGVIGQEPHDDVWMPLPGGTASALVTEEVAAGAAQPTGAVLANVTL
ncbi:anti-sigma factor [Corynebacterium urealyticum]|uniref:Anti-sigma factor n=1 Tax=Corynebacterium urealyticum TaxID=43771 RepID=A0A5D4FY32_9CORY|nr:anti-sigma factor [Corynebacterium urealyticum]